ncbi:MAG: hypothetical protein ACR2FJ_09730 [Qipengyuania sp.]
MAPKEVEPMLKRAILLPLCVLSLAGCDAATQIAGETVEGEARSAIAAQCRQFSEGAGIAAGRIAEVCQCSADTVMADPDLTLADMSRERLEGIVNECAARTGPASGKETATTPTEEIGG